MSLWGYISCRNKSKVDHWLHLICVPAVVAMLICAYSASLHNSYPNPSFPNAYKISNPCTAVDDVAQVRNNHDHFWSWSVEQEKCLSSPAAETQPPQYHMGRPFAYTHRYRPATSNSHNKVPFRVKVLKLSNSQREVVSTRKSWRCKLVFGFTKFPFLVGRLAVCKVRRPLVPCIAVIMVTMVTGGCHCRQVWALDTVRVTSQWQPRTILNWTNKMGQLRLELETKVHEDFTFTQKDLVGAH